MDLNQMRLIGEHVREHQDEYLQRQQPNDELRRLLADRAEAKRPDRSRRPLVLAVVAVCGLVMLVATRLVSPSPSAAPALTFQVDERPGQLNEWIAATAPDHALRSTASLTFSDGSRVALKAAARARVVQLTPNGAEVVLESGAAHFDVVPRPDNDWRVRSGPFVVEVKGTRFDLTWDATDDELTLSLYEGRVEISGCQFLDGQAVIAGQRVRASCRRHQLELGAVETSSPEPPKPSPPALTGPVVSAFEQPSPSTAPSASQLGQRGGGKTEVIDSKVPADRGTAEQQPHGHEPLQGRWLKLARSGHYAEAFDAAMGVGFDPLCAQLDSEQLLLLAETARLSGHSARARQAYRALRTRFGGSTAAARAAFNLGRLDAATGDTSAAAQWFETYLREQPTGSLASLALGRLIEARSALGDRQGAKRHAQDYLRRFPSGAHSTIARQLLTE